LKPYPANLSIKSNSSEAFVGVMLCAGASFDEARTLGIHLRLDLLAHGAAQEVRFAKRVAGRTCAACITCSW
jgi:hypothetical protein